MEILVATGFLALLALSMSQIMGGITDTKNAASVTNDRYHTVQLLLDKMRDDLNMAFIADSKFAGMENKFVSGFKGDEEGMNFSTFSNTHYIKNKRESDQVHVGYSLERNDGGHYNLLRRKTDYLTEDLEKGGASFVLLKNVKELKFDYYDSNKKDWQKAWDTESVSYAGRLPQMVRVIFTLARAGEGEKGEEREYTVLIPLDLYKNKISF